MLYRGEVRGWFVVLLCVGACGRVGFDAIGGVDSSDGGSDGIGAPGAAMDAFFCPFAPSSCPPGYVRGGPESHCYRFTTASVQWFDGEQSCEGDTSTSHLAVVTTAAENACITSLTGGTEVWIGLSSLANMVTYRWVTGPTLSEASWGAGEPTGGGTEQCVSTINVWSTPSCLEAKRFVCEDDGVPASPASYGCSGAPC